MKLPLEEAQARMDSYMGNLELGGMAITELPEEGGFSTCATHPSSPCRRG